MVMKKERAVALVGVESTGVWMASEICLDASVLQSTPIESRIKNMKT